MKVHHIGYAVKSIEKSLKVFEGLGYVKVGDITRDSIRNINILFIKSGNECVELIEPNGESTAVDDVLKKMGSTPYHICYEVDDMDEALADLKLKKFILIKKPELAPAIENKKVAFLYNNDIGLIELVEG